MNTKDIKDRIINDVRRVNEQFQREHPDVILTRDYYRKHKSRDIKESYSEYFGKFSELIAEAGVAKQECSVDRCAVEKQIDDSAKRSPRRYFVTAAIAGGILDEAFMESIQTYCKLNNAHLILLAMRGIKSKKDVFGENILQYSDYFCTEYIFNAKLRAQDFLLSPQVENPVNSLKRFGHKNYSMIVASPKQFLTIVPVSKEMLPHALFSTGSVTVPEYAQTTQGRKAWQDHCCGGLIVEIHNNEIFFVRQVQSDRHGGFYDLDKYYCGKMSKKIRARAIVLGDIHTGFSDEKAIQASFEQIDLLNPEFVIVHDLFDGHSITHHHINNIERQVNKKSEIRTLEKELKAVGENLLKLTRRFPKQKFIVVRSNHDEFLDRYLREGRYVFDKENHKLALQLAIWMLDGYNPLQYYIEKNFNIKNVYWLSRTNDYMIEGVQVGIHGDKGSNGGKGSIAGIELSHGNSMYGHTHSPSILRHTWVVGTNTKLRLEYNEGEASSWLHANGVIYSEGLKSIIISIDGKWRIKNGR